MWYFYHSVGIKCFCQCTRKERDHLSIHDTSLDEPKMGAVVIRQKWLLTDLPSSSLLYLFLSLCFSAYLGRWHDLETSLEVTRGLFPGLSQPPPEANTHTLTTNTQQSYLYRWTVSRILDHSLSEGAEATHTHTYTGKGYSQRCESIMSCHRAQPPSRGSGGDFSGEMHSLTTWSPDAAERSELLTALQCGFV